MTVPANDWSFRIGIGEDVPYEYEQGSDLINAWLYFIYDLMTYRRTMIFGCRKFVAPVTWWVDGSTFVDCPFLVYRQLGYGWNSPHGGRGKMRQMERNYFDPIQVEAARHKMQQRIDLGRKQSSVSLRLQNRDKESRAQGFCMQNAVFTHFRPYKHTDHFTIDVYYRVTEVTQKFAADIKFLRDRIIPGVLGEHAARISQVRFHFAQIYVSAVYMPILFSFAPPEEWLKPMRDQQFQDMLCRGTENLFMTESKYSYRSHALMHEVWKEYGQETDHTRPFIQDWRVDKDRRVEEKRSRRRKR